MKRFFWVLFLFILSSCWTTAVLANNVIIDVAKIVGKSEQEVNKILGNPTSCTQSKYGRKCNYAKNDTEIVFIKSKADWITINETGNAAYKQNSLSLIGLQIKEPDFNNSNVMRWNKLNGLHEISFFPSGENIFYIYIKAFTP